jgi:primosomal protein N'
MSKPVQNFEVGCTVRVPLGIRTYDATVLGQRNGRLRVAVHVPGADEPITTSYLPADVRIIRRWMSPETRRGFQDLLRSLS